MKRTASRRSDIARQRAALDEWLSTQESANTRSAYRSDLKTFGTWCVGKGMIPLTADTTALIAFQAARREAGDSDATIRRRWSALSSFYDHVVQQQLRSSNPSAGVDRPKVPVGDPSPTMALSDAAVASYRRTAAALDPRLEALVALLVCDGLKVSEALALDIADVSGRSTTTITVRRRGQSQRVVLDHDSARALRRCIGKRRAGPVFVNEQSSRSEGPRRLSRFGADHLIRKLRTGASNEQVTANALRRFHISTNQRAGIALDDVRAGAGLADTRSVRRFTD